MRIELLSFELFASVLAALVTYRIVSPVIDALNPFNRTARGVVSGECKTSGSARSLGVCTEFATSDDKAVRPIN